MPYQASERYRLALPTNDRSDNGLSNGTRRVDSTLLLPFTGRSQFTSEGWNLTVSYTGSTSYRLVPAHALLNGPTVAPVHHTEAQQRLTLGYSCMHTSAV